MNSVFIPWLQVIVLDPLDKCDFETERWVHDFISYCRLWMSPMWYLGAQEGNDHVISKGLVVVNVHLGSESSSNLG